MAWTAENITWVTLSGARKHVAKALQSDAFAEIWLRARLAKGLIRCLTTRILAEPADQDTNDFWQRPGDFLTIDWQDNNAAWTLEGRAGTIWVVLYGIN